MAKKSLAEQIAAFANPTTDFDIETEEFGVGAKNFDDESGSESEDDSAKQDHYVNVEKSKLRRENENIALGGKYKGALTSRKDLDEDSEEEEESEEEELEESQEELGNEESEDIGGASDDEELDVQSEEIDDDESDLGADLSQNESEDDFDQETEIKRSKLKALMSRERQHIVNRLSQSTVNDSIKGYAVLHQQAQFDSIIDSRLKLQKAVTNSNLLPIDSKAIKLGKGEKSKLHESIEKCYDVLDTIFKLRTEVLAKDQITTKEVSYKPKKRTLDEYLSATQKYDDVIGKFRGTTLTKWSAKIQNSSGSTALSSTKFKAINQSAEQQVQNNLSDMDRLVKRTKLNRKNIEPLAFEYYKSKYLTQEEEESEQEEENPDLPKQNNKPANEKAELPSIFDDEDFYRVLLNDLVEKKIQSSNPANGMTIALRNSQHANKMKKNVDTKASKGRKLRYHVQEQIANFETPREAWKWNDDQIDEFFASLLGQKVNMNEIEEEDVEEEVADSGITLFG